MQTKGQFTLMNRQEFKDWLYGQTFTRDIKIIQEHHTLIPAYSDFNGNNHFDMCIGMRNYHVSEAGYSDIAQNATTFPDGMIMICRPFNAAPAGIKGCNGVGLCIENVGNFDKGMNTLTEEHKLTILFMAAVLCMRFKLTPSVDSITYHHWWDLNTGTRTFGTGTTKSCPGSNWFGGNTKEAAIANFLPLVVNKISAIKNPVVAVPAGPTAEQIAEAERVRLLKEKVAKIMAEVRIVFKDMIDGNGNVHWSNDAVNYLEDKGIVKGKTDANGEKIFDPNAPITRAESVVIVAKAMQKLEEMINNLK